MKTLENLFFGNEIPFELPSLDREEYHRLVEELGEFEDPLFESPGVGFSLWSLPLWPAALVADCLLSTETCGKHKGPIAIALERLSFPD